MTAAASILGRLLRQGLLSPASAVQEGWLVVEVSVSHRAFIVNVGGRPRFFAKLADPVRSLGRDLSVEAGFYRLAASTPSLRGVAPACRLVTDDDTLIVLDAVPGSSFAAKTLRGVGSDPDGGMTHSVLRQYGRAVARVHQVQPEPLGQAPWMLVALETASSGYTWLPEPCRDLLLRAASWPQFRAGFRAARRSWRATKLVHGDLRWANVLVDEKDPAPQVWLVDWELACRGEPAWDIGCVLADLLASADFRRLRSASPPIVQWPTLVFLEAYRRQARLAPAVWFELLRRSLRLAGVRLVQTLVEYGHVSEDALRDSEPLLLPWAAEFLGDSSPSLSALARALSLREKAWA